MPTLKDLAPEIVEKVRASGDYLEHNHELFNIYEGDLLTYILRDLQAQLSDRSYQQIKYRVTPVNILKRLIDKLSKIYKEAPKRDLSSTNEKDLDAFNFYMNSMNINMIMQQGNEFFNLFKSCLLEPYLDGDTPRLRVIPSDRFVVCSYDNVNPNKPTHIAKIMGKVKKNYVDPETKQASETTLIYMYSADEFLIVESDGTVRTDLMDAAGSDGTNPYGVLPFVYVNRSHHILMPKADSDTLAMTKLIPVLLSDLNYAVMFQSFSIIYGIDIDFDNITQAPNALWSFKSDATSNKEPKLGSIKPEVDIDQVLNFIAAQIQLWFQTKNIKAGAIGDLTVSNAASGISKAIDEADTSEDRTSQTRYFAEAEARLWDLILNVMHPVWLRTPGYGATQAISPNVSVNVTFPVQKPIVDPSIIIKDGISKIQNGLATREMVISEIYPDKTPEQIEVILAEIQDERTIEVDQNANDDDTGSQP
jgi:hypothetical protein